jgi:hypothetical protein
VSHWLGGIALLLLACTASAIERVQLSWGSLGADAWRAQDISLELDWGAADAARLTLSVAQLEIGGERISGIRLACNAFELLREAAHCRKGTLAFASDWIKAQQVPVSFDYRFDTASVDVSLAQLPLAGGAAQLVVHQQTDAWRLEAVFNDVLLAQLAALGAKFGVKLPALELAGSVNGRVKLRGGTRGLGDIDWQLQTQQFGYSNAAGSQAGEALAVAGRGRAARPGPTRGGQNRGGGLSGRRQARSRRGRAPSASPPAEGAARSAAARGAADARRCGCRGGSEASHGARGGARGRCGGGRGGRGNDRRSRR